MRFLVDECFTQISSCCLCNYEGNSQLRLFAWGIRKTNTKVLENSYKNHTIGVLTGLCEGCYNPVKKIQEKHFRN